MIVINETKCIGCGRCAADCISGTIRIRDGKAKARQGCLLCGHCLAVCPADVGRILRTFKIKKNVEVTDNGKIII